MSSEPTRKPELEAILRQELDVEVPYPRNRDCLDFYDCHVSNLWRALEAAYKMGQEDARKSAT